MRSSQPQTSVPLADVQSTPLTRIPTVIRWTGLARSTIYRLIAEQKVPTPVVLATQARYKWLS
jgi:prophage regulatory protein